MGSTVPAGYLICNGSAVSRTAYDKLFQAIGTKYGEGDGSTTFNLPNLIGKFLQGDVISGTVKNAGLPNITGGVSSSTYASGVILMGGNGAFATGASAPTNAVTGNYTPATVSSSASFDASRSSSIYGNSDTVQPPSVTSIPCIKAFDSVIDATTVSVAQLSDTKVNKAGDTMTGSLTAPSFITNGIDCSVDSQGDNWIRYSNGLQICWGVSNSVRVNSFETVAIQVSYKAFKSNPSLSLAPFNGTNCWAQLQWTIDPTSTYAHIGVYNNSVQSDWAATQYLWQAIGYWK